MDIKSFIRKMTFIKRFYLFINFRDAFTESFIVLNDELVLKCFCDLKNKTNKLKIKPLDLFTWPTIMASITAKFLRVCHRVRPTKWLFSSHFWPLLKWL